ncbi:hypothetical protein B0J17DRAFT_391841 [Rhizoctonia solani]|nr:hypothetical protein B0J17DRAFT_391841 [Rhizoctonia solani]
MNAANLFDRNPLHVVHLQGPVDRLHDTNMRAIYERAGKILLIQRWNHLTTSAPHAFLLFETEQAANNCCNRISAPRITTPNNSHPQSITASILQPNQPNHPALQQWLSSQNMVPSYVIKSSPPPPKAAGFPLSCLRMLNEDASDVVGKLKEFKCGPGWWRFVAQMNQIMTLLIFPSAAPFHRFDRVLMCRRTIRVLSTQTTMINLTYRKHKNPPSPRPCIIYGYRARKTLMGLGPSSESRTLSSSHHNRPIQIWR